MLYCYSAFLPIMKIVKLVLLACPVLLASMLLVANPAAASSVNSTPETPHIAVVSAQPNHEAIAPKLSADSNPIMDQLGCNCATCVKAKLQMEGKLPLTSLL